MLVMSIEFNDNATIGSKLRDWQERNYYSQQAIIRMINEIYQQSQEEPKDILNVNNISKIYYGDMEMKVSHIISWCELMGCTPNDILLKNNDSSVDRQKVLYWEKAVQQYNDKFNMNE